jgi:hypothetical protein
LALGLGVDDALALADLAEFAFPLLLEAMLFYPEIKRRQCHLQLTGLGSCKKCQLDRCMVHSTIWMGNLRPPASGTTFRQDLLCEASTPTNYYLSSN